MKVILFLLLPLADIVTDWFTAWYEAQIVNFFQGIIDTCCGMIPIIGGILGTTILLYLRKRKRQS